MEQPEDIRATIPDPSADADEAERGSEPGSEGSGSVLLDRVVALEGDRRIDPVVERIEAWAAPRLGAGPARQVLGGQWLGHALHPLMTDLPIGLWTAGVTLDWVGGRSAAPAAQRLIGLGVIAAVPTALSGWSDWTVLRRPAQRVGVVHAAANAGAVLCFSGSWAARRRGHRLRGRLLAVAGGSAMALGGYLGGHLTVARSAGADATADVLAVPPEPPV